MFRTVPLTIIRSFSLYTQQWYMSHRFAVSKSVWHIPFLCVQWKNPDDGQRNCPKHVEFYSKNKFEKLVHLIGFTIRMNCALLGILSVDCMSYINLLFRYENKTNNWIWTYVKLLHYKGHKPPTCFGQLLCPSSRRCFSKYIVQRCFEFHLN